MNRYKISPYTSFLFAPPSFWGGFGQVLDMGATRFRFNTSEDGDQADYFALLSDWKAVGDDLRSAMGILDEELSEVAPA